MHDLILRAASALDSDFAYHVKKSAFREYVEKVWGWNEAEQRQLHERRFLPSNCRVIQLSGRDIGVLCLLRNADCVNLKQLFILPEHQCKGIGKACMLQVIRDADAWGLPVRLQLLKVNHRALVFYKRLGFNDIGETPTHRQMQRAVTVPPSR